MHATARYGRLKTYNNSDNRAHAVSAQAYRRFFPANSEIKLPGGGVEGVELLYINCSLNSANTLSNYVLGGQLYTLYTYNIYTYRWNVQPPVNFSLFKHWANLIKKLFLPPVRISCCIKIEAMTCVANVLDRKKAFRQNWITPLV